MKTLPPSARINPPFSARLFSTPWSTCILTMLLFWNVRVAALPAPSATVPSGTVNGETLGFSGQGGRFDTPSVGRGKVVTVSDLTLVNGSGLANNYNLLQQSGLSADINVPAAAQNVVQQLTSNVLSLTGTRAGGGELSTNFTVIPSLSANVNTGSNAVADVTLRIGNSGSTLQIVTGGVRLPDNVTLRIGNDGSTLQIVASDIMLPVNLSDLNE